MTRRTSKRQQPFWAKYSDDQLLDLRFSDLGLELEGTVLEERVERLYAELEQRELRFRPHCWLSTEWFSPDGVPGIAIPFYLAHQRLSNLEESQILEVEGGTQRWCMQLLRHEAAHALDSAFRLHRRKTWRETFGSFRTPYSKFYRPKPYSKSYVLHLDLWYAQSHPAEDWAETFAVWLNPASRWRKRYQGWPALKKLEYVDRLMGDIAGHAQKVRSREKVEPIHRNKSTLREHYAEKKRRYGLDRPQFYDRDLRRLFGTVPEDAQGKSAHVILRRLRPEIRRRVAYWTGEYQYTIDQVLAEMIQRCQSLSLRTARDEASVRQDAMVLLAIQTLNYLHSGHHRVAR